MPLYTVDRFEGSEWAVLEDELGITLRIRRHWLPLNAAEGDVINASVDGGTELTSVQFELKPHERGERLAEARRLRDALSPGPKGDLDL